MTRPNFVIIVTDDHGYGDLGCMGADDLKTPHLDALAANGVLFTSWYSNSPVCSPSRAALLTGRHPARTGIREILGGHRSEIGLGQGVPTLASALKPLGYRTSLVGKWHLGVAEGYRPSDHGFDDWFGILSGLVDYFSHINYSLWPWNPDYHPVHDLWENDREAWRNGKYLTDLISDRAVDVIRNRSEDPFLLYVGYTAPHSPMHAPAEYVDRFPELSPARRIMAAMLSAVDDGIGAIVSELESQGILEDTCIFFMSDNGPARHPANWLDGNLEPYYGARADQLRGGKGSLFEGGIRAPALLQWPARVPAGQVIDEPAMAMDIFPTLIQAAGGTLDQFDVDGKDLMGMLVEQEPTPHEVLTWEFRQQTAVRVGPWKLVLRPVESDATDDWEPEGSEARAELDARMAHRSAPADEAIFLFNLDEDLGETTNLREARPDVVTELLTIAMRWRASLTDDPDEDYAVAWSPSA